MLTFQTLYEDTADIVQDSDATSLALIKRWINQGQKKFGAELNREWRSASKTFSLVADQQFYFLPAKSVRPISLVITIGGVDYPLTEVADEDAWNRMNMHKSTETSEIPSHFYVQSNNRVGIYPVPASNQSNAAVIRYERIMQNMSVDDFDTGTITATTDDETITHNATGFTAKMVGRTLLVEDDTSEEGIGYKIASFTDTSNLELEREFEGAGGAGLDFRIGETPDIPEEYHESLIDYACYRYYLRRRDRGMVRDFRALYKDALEECKANYSSQTASSYIAPRRGRALYVHSRRDYEV